MNILLWIVQIMLALLFLFAGGTKLIMSTHQLEPWRLQERYTWRVGS
jgi:hypothetical protein